MKGDLRKSINYFSKSSDKMLKIIDINQSNSHFESLYNNLLEESISKIFIESENEFIQNLHMKCNEKLVEYFRSNEKETKILKEIKKLHVEKINNKIRQIRHLVNKTYKEFNNNTKNYTFLTLARYHCSRTQKTPLHECKGRLLVVKENKIIKYLLCCLCKKLLLPNFLKLHCEPCRINYLSETTSNEKECEIHTVTWDKYHCKSSITLTEQPRMKCPLCKEKLFFKVTDQALFCKCCKFHSEPNKVNWNCVFCKEEFSSNVKILNNYHENQLLKSLKQSILDKLPALPEFIKCCKSEKSKYQYKHSKECQGNLIKVQFEISDSKFFTCDVCKYLIDSEGLTWECNECGLKFKDQIYNPIQKFSLRKDFNLRLKNDSQTKLKIPSMRNSESCIALNLLQKIEEKPRILEKSAIDYLKYNSQDQQLTPRIENRKLRPENIVGKLERRDFLIEDLKKSKEFKNLIVKSDSKIRNEINSISPVRSRQKAGYLSEIAKTEGNESSAYHENYERPIISKRKSKANYSKASSSLSEINKDNSIGMFNSNSDYKNCKKETNENSISSYGSSPNHFLKKVSLNDKNNYNSNKNQKSGWVDNFKFSIDDFTLIKKIGDGSFGVIYQAEHKKTKKKHAIKKILVKTEEEYSMFQKEYELLIKHQNPNILKIFGICEKSLDSSTKVLYILMELAIMDWDKEVKSRNKTKNEYSEKELILILNQIVKPLVYLQNQGISHRDIKPQNILLFENFVYKLADFGEAKVVLKSKTDKDTLRGTELYMSPILFHTLRKGDSDCLNHNVFKSDVYSLGFCLIYAATLSVKILYDLRNVKERKTVVSIVMTYLDKKFSGRFIEMVLRMIEVDEEKRFDFVDLSKFIFDYFKE